MPLRFVHIGDTYNINEEDEGGVDLEQVEMTTPEPPEDIEGEPWDWTKDGPRPPARRSDDPITWPPFPERKERTEGEEV